MDTSTDWRTIKEKFCIAMEETTHKTEHHAQYQTYISYAQLTSTAAFASSASTFGASSFSSSAGQSSFTSRRTDSSRTSAPSDSTHQAGNASSAYCDSTLASAFRDTGRFNQGPRGSPTSTMHGRSPLKNGKPRTGGAVIQRHSQEPILHTTSKLDTSAKIPGLVTPTDASNLVETFSQPNLEKGPGTINNSSSQPSLSLCRDMRAGIREESRIDKEREVILNIDAKEVSSHPHKECTTDNSSRAGLSWMNFEYVGPQTHPAYSIPKPEQQYSETHSPSPNEPGLDSWSKPNKAESSVGERPTDISESTQSADPALVSVFTEYHEVPVTVCEYFNPSDPLPTDSSVSEYASSPHKAEKVPSRFAAFISHDKNTELTMTIEKQTEEEQLNRGKEASVKGYQEDEVQIKEEKIDMVEVRERMEQIERESYPQLESEKRDEASAEREDAEWRREGRFAQTESSVKEETRKQEDSRAKAEWHRGAHSRKEARHSGWSAKTRGTSMANFAAYSSTSSRSSVKAFSSSAKQGIWSLKDLETGNRNRNANASDLLAQRLTVPCVLDHLTKCI